MLWKVCCNGGCCEGLVFPVHCSMRVRIVQLSPLWEAAPSHGQGGGAKDGNQYSFFSFFFL